MGSIYSVEKRAGGWVILVGEDEIMTCSRRAVAIRVIQQAGVYLRDDLQNDGSSRSPKAAASSAVAQQARH
jgi:hypothetical protein